MAIFLVTSNPLIADPTVTYGTSAVYTGTVEFNMTGLGLSAVSAVNLESMTFSSDVTSPNVVFNAGVTFPHQLLTVGAATEALTYTITANNNLLHATTLDAIITTALTATPVLNADTSIVDDPEQYAEYVGTGFANGTIHAAGDATAPDPVTGLTATAGDRIVTLNWTQPVSHADWVNTVVRQASVPVSAVGIGTAVLTTTGYNVSSYVATAPSDVVNTQYFGVYTVDNVGNKSAIVQANAQPMWGKWVSKAEHSRRYVQDEF